MKRPVAAALILACLLAGCSSSSEVKPAPATRVIYEDTRGNITTTRYAILGMRVDKVAEAIKNPNSPGAMDAVLELGLDSRYYAMVRGWLAYELVAAESIADATKPTVYQHIQDRIDFLKEAIRRIDLE